MYKRIKQAFIVIFFALIFIPVLLSDKTGGAKSETENRYLAKMPSIKELSIGSFNNWFNDNIAFRQDIIGIKGYIEYNFLHKSPTDKVIFGKDGFMFYTRDDNIAIAQNKYPLSEIELRKSIKNLRLANDILAKHHKTFVFSIAPSKVGIYPEYLYVKTADEIKTPIDIFDEALKDKVNFVNLKKALYKEKEKNKDMFLYYKTDTHWSLYGAYTGYKQILDEFNSIGVFGNKKEPYMEVNLVKASRTGEFANMMGASYILKPEETYNTVILNSKIMADNLPDFLNNYQQKYNPFRVFAFKNYNQDKNGKILVIGDSMFGGWNLPELIANHFKNYYHIWEQKFDNQTVMNSGADVILFEIGERYSRLVGYVLNDFVQKNYRPKAVISSDDIPEVMENGKTYSFNITIENKGEYNLGYDYMTILGVLLDSSAYDNIDQKIIFQLPKDIVIKPGEKFTYKITNFTPDYKGKFITFKCGEETVDWISNSIKVNLK